MSGHPNETTKNEATCHSRFSAELYRHSPSNVTSSQEFAIFKQTVNKKEKKEIHVKSEIKFFVTIFD